MTANPLLKWGGGTYAKVAPKLRDHIGECVVTAQFESQFHYYDGDAPFAITYTCQACGKKFWFELDDS